jgi:general stress protein YciG
MVDTKQRGSEHRGFAAMDADKQRMIASKGGKAAHQKGTAHEFSSEEARAAGRKGGEARARHAQQLAKGGSSTDVNSPNRNMPGGSRNSRVDEDEDDTFRKSASPAGDDDSVSKQAPGRDDGSGMGMSGSTSDPNRNL